MAGQKSARVADRDNARPGAPPAVPDHNVARSLSERVAEGQRLAFARSFTHAALHACWRGRGIRFSLAPLPESIEDMPLSDEAAGAADRFGTATAGLAPAAIAHLIGTLYTTALPRAYRASLGIFYTPPALVERLLVMAEEAGVSWRTARILDPACGGGAFLVPIATRIVASLDGTDAAFILQQLGARLRGFDLDAFGTWLAKAMLDIALSDVTRVAGKPTPHMIEARDSLASGPADEEAYDLVIGNPPYGRVSLAAEQRKRFARSVYGHANIYGLFTDAALRWVKHGGVIGYVTPTSMLSGLYFKALRHLLASEAPPLAVNFVAERDGVFDGVLQETMLATYRRGGIAHGGGVGFLTVGRRGQIALRKSGTIMLPRRSSAPWLLPRSSGQALLTRRLSGMPHRLSHYGYGVSTGPLVWNRFKSQFRDTPASGSLPVIWAESVTSRGRFLWRSEKRNHAPWFAAKRPKDDWLIVDRPCVLLQRTTAKEQARRLIAAELPESFIRKHGGVTVENHLNMIRAILPKPSVPASVIAALLNSATVDAAFRCINGSVAVSAFEIEELPLPPPSAIAKLARLVASHAPTSRIEAMIAAAYRITDAAATS